MATFAHIKSISKLHVHMDYLAFSSISANVLLLQEAFFPPSSPAQPRRLLLQLSLQRRRRRQRSLPAEEDRHLAQMEEGEGAAADAKEEPRGRSRIHHGTGKKLVLFLDIIFLICPFQRVLRKRHEKSVLILVLIVFIFIVCHSFRLGVQTYQARYF